VEKYCRVGQATNENTAHALCMIDTEGYRQALRICYTDCFSSATMVARTRLNVTLYVHCLSCFYRITLRIFVVPDALSLVGDPFSGKSFGSPNHI